MNNFKTSTDDMALSDEAQVDKVSQEFGPECDDFERSSETGDARQTPQDDVSDAILASVAAHADDTTSTVIGHGEVPSTVSSVDDQQTSAPTTARYKPFPLDALPRVVRNYVTAAAAAIGCDLAFIALPLLASLARAIGNRRVIRLKSTWLESAIIWAAIVGKSGTHKTPAMQAATKILQLQENKSYQEFEKALKEYQELQLVYERDLAAWKHSNDDLSTPPPEPPKQPSCVRYIVSDITIEALAARLASQFDGVLVVRDELSSWFGGIAEYKGGKGSDLGQWLASWSGLTLTVDRKTGPQQLLRVPRAAVSIVGGIQPAVLKQAIGREHMQDGLCPRLLLAMPHTRPVLWTDATVSPEIEAAMAGVIKGLLALEPAVDENDNPTPHAIPLSEKAKVIWVEYFNRHRAEAIQFDEDLAAAWSKLEAYTARFALIFQLCSLAAGEPNTSADVIDEVAMLNAITLSDWFGGEAKRVYEMFTESEPDRRERELLELIHRKGGSISVRDLMRSSPRSYRTAEAAEAALNVLVGRGRGRWGTVPPGAKGGRPTSVLQLVDTADIDVTSETITTYEVVSSGMMPQVRSEVPIVAEEADPTANPVANVGTVTNEPAYGEV